ncbi:MAG: hypothetical protein CMO55_18415 [Verrucomicrobiales bacterium]|nr:hypothetical protein [Verrucomicrobiales bacterium]
MKPPESPVQAAADVLNSIMTGQREAILSTVSSDGRPHATWMSTMTNDDISKIITLTSPDSHKVENIEFNPEVEWLFTAPNKRELVYLHGTAEIIRDVAKMKKAWQAVPNKQRAFFLNFFTSAPGYAVIETTVRKVVYGMPAHNFFHEFDPEELASQAVGQS